MLCVLGAASVAVGSPALVPEARTGDDLKVFYINMNRCGNRREQTERQLRNAGIKDFERFAAVTPATASSLGFEVSPSVDARSGACALSHMSLYKRVVDDNLTAALILEDDVEIDAGLLERAKEFDQALPSYDMLMLGW